VRAIIHSAAIATLGALAIVGAAATAAAQSIQGIEINQAIGAQKDGNLKFVAGKDTVVRAIMDAPVTVDPSASSARIIRNGEPIATLAPRSTAAAGSIVDFLCPTRSACGNWAAGSYEFDVTVNGANRSTAGTAYVFHERGQLRVLALPVRTNYAGTILSVQGDAWKSLWEFTRNVYPIAPDKFKWTTRQELDASAFDVETDEGKRGVWEALANLNPPRCAADKTEEGCFDKIIGFIPARYGTYPTGTGQGYTFGSPANIAVASDEDAAATVAHEIAHNFGIGDAYNGGSFACRANPTPDAFSGSDFDTQQPVQCTAGRVALEGVSGTLVPATHHPYEVGGRGALGNVAEFMGSGGLQAQFWASQDTWDWIFDRLLPPAAPAPAAAQPLMTGPLHRTIEFEGYIRRNALSTADVTLAPWQSFMDDDVVPDTTGPFMVAAVNGAGQRLASSAFTPVFDFPGGKGEPATHLDLAPFEGAIRFPEGTTAFRIIRNDQVLREAQISANAPSVSGVSLGVGTVFNGVTSISWTATDADGDALWYSVEYNPDVTNPAFDYEILATDLRTPNLVDDFADIPGGARAKIRIGASDGFNTTYAESAEFQVPFKPPVVAIEPLAQTTIPAGEELLLEADAWDLQDDLLPDAALVWTSNVSGALGTGEVLVVYDLPAGQHVITLTATNSAGLTASSTVTVTVSP